MLITEEIKQIFEQINNVNEDTFSNTFNQTTTAPTVNTSNSTAPKTNVQPKKQATQPGDVNYLSKVSNSATTVNKAAQKINTTNEFSGAFKNWFSSLGYTPENNQVSISRVMNLVKNTMTELGYK